MRRVLGYTTLALFALILAANHTTAGLWFLTPVLLVIHHERRIQHQVRTLINGIDGYRDNRP